MLGWRVAGSAFAAVCLLTGAALAASSVALQKRHQVQAYERPVNRIVVDLGAGRLSVRTGGPGVIVDRRLTWSWIRPSIAERWDGRTLTITTVCGSRKPPSVAVNCRTDYALTIPAAAGLDVRTTDGDIDVAGVRGDLRLASSGGGITAVGAAGTVSARTQSGDVSLRFDRPPASAEVASESGDVAVAVPRDGRYRVQANAQFEKRIAVTVVPAPAAPSLISAATDTGTIRIAYG